MEKKLLSLCVVFSHLLNLYWYFTCTGRSSQATHFFNQSGLRSAAHAIFYALVRCFITKPFYVSICDNNFISKSN